MAVGGNNGGAGGAKNIARARRKPKPVATGSRGDGISGAKPTPRVVKPPAGDVASSGGDYGTGQAKRAATSKPVRRATRAVYEQQPVKQRQAILRHATGPTGKVVRDIHEERRQRAEDLAHAQAEHDILTGHDLKAANAYNAAHPVKRKQLASDIYLTDPAALKAAGFKAPGILDKVAQSPGKFTANAFTDAAELAATTPTSTYMLGKTAVTHPTKLPGMLAAPYKQLLTDPKFAFEHPVSAALMVAPVAKVPGLAAGKVLRLAGKQTLKGETRTLPGTALREETRRSKDALVNARQARAQRARPAPAITDAEIRRRVDEHFEYRRKHVRRVEAAKAGQIREQAKALPKDERAAFKDEQAQGARAGASTQNDRTFVREFGSTWQVHKTPEGRDVVVKPKDATEGHLHASRADAQKVVDRLAKAGHGDFAIKPVSENEFGVVPSAALAHLKRHEGVGHSAATYAKVMRASRQKFTNAVLPLSPKWLTGQLVEGTLRANVHAGGPVGVATGLIRERKVFKALERDRPGAGKEFRARALPGGHYGGQVQEFRATPLHEIFNEAEDGKLGAALAKVGQAGSSTRGAKLVVNGWNRYTRAVFDQVNGRFIENPQQRAMLGRALKDSPLMERRLLGLSDKAAREAAEGLRGTETQVQFGRAVERAYGKYSNFSPTQRERNAHWTPFLPWYSNAVQFLTSVLPKDHPVLTSLLAAGNVGTQKEREKLGLSLHGANHKPLFMQGGIPAPGGNVIRLGHYTPFALGESKPSESLASLPLPQFTGTLKNAFGIDWKGDPLKHGVGFTAKDFTEPETLARALATQAEALAPGAGQLARITGLEDKLSGKENAQTLLHGPHKGKRLLAAVNKEINPVRPTGTGPAPSASAGVKIPVVKVRPVKVKAIKIKPIRVR